MIDLPATTETPLVRTDYSDDVAWRALVGLIQAPSEEGFLAVVEIVEDPSLAGVAADALTGAYAKRHALLIVADARSMSDPGHPLLCIDLESLRSLRVLPSSLWSIENNLSLANMDFEDFVEAAGEAGVFSGFG